MQVSTAPRLGTFLDETGLRAEWESNKAKIKSGKRVGGIMKPEKPIVSVSDYALKAYLRVDGNEQPLNDAGEPIGLAAPAINSIRNGLMDDVGMWLAQTTIVKVDGVEMPGDVWYAAKLKAGLKPGKAQKPNAFIGFAAALDALVKADKKALVHRGVTIELSDSIVKYSSGKKGKQAKSLLRIIDNI